MNMKATIRRIPEFILRVQSLVVLVLIFSGCIAANPRPASDERAPLGPSGEAPLRMAFPPPPGAERVPTDAFGIWLADLPMRGSDERVLTYAGDIVSHHARVVDLPLVPGDLQQCADTAIRLRAEWLRDNRLPVAFHSTSGDMMPWSRWQSGEKPYVRGNKLAWKRGSDRSWNGYLASVFTWAGTRSLSFDTVHAESPRAGDLLVVPGSPGHAVVLLDVAIDSGVTYVLIGEGYMPAQSFHVEIGPHFGWWEYSEAIDLGHITMPTSGLRRWKS